MRRTITQSALVFASVLLIIALAGCGGSSKKTTAGGMMPAPDPDPAPAPGTAITGLPAGHTLASGTIAAGASQTILAYSKGRSATISCPSGGAACVVTVADDGTARATGATPTVSVTTNELVWQANNGPAGSSDGAHALHLARRLVTQATPLGSATSYSVTGLGEGNMQTTLAALPVVTPSMEWTRGTSPTLGLTLGSTTFSNLDSSSLPTNSGKLSVDSGSGSVIPSLGSGWNGAALSKDLSEVNGRTIRGVVYTNAAKPTGGTADTPARTFGAEGFDLSGHSALSTLLGAAADPTAAQELTIEGFKVTIPAAAITTLRTGAPQNIPITVSVEYDDDGTTRTRSNARLTCAQLTCRSVGGNLQGSWTLSAPKVTGTAGTQDSDYQVLGSWLVLPNGAAATGSYNLGVFQFASSARLAQSNLDGNSGDITFEGPATGVYTTGMYTGTGTSRRVTSADVGSFTADVELVGAFGASGGAGTFAGVRGTVDSFTDDNGKSLGWTMSLQATGPGTAATDELFTGETVLETTGGQSATGNWGVGFYWNAQRTPAGLGFAGGTFDASTATSEDNLLHVVGAFAAERQ